MKFIKIGNVGEVDVRLLTLIGGTTKTGNEDVIGRYGSGWKYTLAWLLRNNLMFHIYSGEKETQITTVTEEIGGIEFDIIVIDGQKTSITTKMGPDFLAWHCIREVYSNSLDAGESTHEVVSECTGEAGRTNVYIQITPEIQQVLDKWNKYFIHDQHPISDTYSYKIYPGGDALRLYKQGILIHEDTEMKSLFAYDITHASINELREFSGSPMYYCAEALKNAGEKAIQYYLENISDQYWEGKRLDYDWISSKWSGKWKEVIGSAKIIHQKAIDNSRAKGIEIDESNYIVVPEKVYKALTSQFDGIGGLRMAQKGMEFYEQYCSKTENRVNQAMAILETCDYPLHKELDYRYGFFADKTVEARVNIEEKIVYVSQGMLQKPLSDVVAMLIEENEHYNTGYNDHTREFQQHFIDLYTRQLLKNHAIEV